jgi:hypothetical protein
MAITSVALAQLSPLAVINLSMSMASGRRLWGGRRMVNLRIVPFGAAGASVGQVVNDD